MFTIATILLYYARHEIRLWTWVVAIVIIAVFYIASKLTKNQFLNYRKRIEIKSVKSVIIFLHLTVSFVMAILLPNNFLQNFATFKNIYSENGMWIFVSILLLFFIFMIAIGYLLNLFTNYIFQKK